MDKIITLKPFDISEITVDSEMPVASRRVIISKEAAEKISNLTEEKRGSIDEAMLTSFKGEALSVDEPIEVIDAEPVINEPVEVVPNEPVIAETPVQSEPANQEFFFPQPEQNTVVEPVQNESVVPDIFTAPPVVEQPVVNNEPTEIVDTAVEQPVINDVEDDGFLFDDTSDQDIYEATKTM